MISAEELEAGRREVEEAEANHFAMCLLMPEHLVRRAVRERGGFDIEDSADVHTLARLFRVSDSLMAVRLGQLMRRR